MAAARPPDPVQLVVALLWADPGARDAAARELAARWGAIAFVGADHPFDVTGYYLEEMGAQLWRRLLAFDPLVPPDILPRAKIDANRIEVALAVEGRRRVNLDVGYLDHHKLVLASGKAAGQKVYLADGIYADLMLRYAHGRLKPFEWTFPDFRDGRYEQELLEIRRGYLQRLRNECR